MTDGSSDGKNMAGGERADTDELPLNHLRPCVSGENGVPAWNAMSENSDGETGMPHKATSEDRLAMLTLLYRVHFGSRIYR